MNQTSATRPFGKYERFGAYHWREIRPVPTQYNAILTARYRVLLERIDPTARRVVDIGCGDGTLTFQLAQSHQRAFGIDDSLLPLRLARGEFLRRPTGREPLLASADARRLPFADEAFDCVVLADVIEHIDAPGSVMREAQRVLRRGGQIILTTPRRQGEAPSHEYHCREYTAAELGELLNAWFADVEVRVFQPAAVAHLYDRKVLRRKMFRVAINCCAVLGWNPLAKTGALSDEASYMDLCASGRKR